MVSTQTLKLYKSIKRPFCVRAEFNGEYGVVLNHNSAWTHLGKQCMQLQQLMQTLARNMSCDDGVAVVQ